MELKNIAIIGPRGNVGSTTIVELLKDPTRFNITAIVRPSSNYTAPEGSSIVVKTADFDSLESLSKAFEGQDAIVNCVSGSATQYDPSKLIIDAAVATPSLQFYFANEFVGYVTSPQFRRLPESAAGAKVRIRNYLEELGKEGKLKWTSLNGGPFFDMWLMKGPAGFDVKNKKMRRYGTGENKLFWTPLSTMAKVVVRMLREPEKVVNRPIYIAPIPHLTQNIILAALEEVLGEKFHVEDVDVKTINEHALIALERGEVGKAMKGLTVSNQFFEGDCGNNFSALVENELVGVQEMSVEEAIRDAVDRWGLECEIVEGLFRVEACEI